MKIRPVILCGGAGTRLWPNQKKHQAKQFINFGNGTLWKYAQTVGPAYLGAPTHPGGKNEVKVYADI